ncbi:MAG TPA: OmpA family protein [Longimicrobiales bacterium]|nr:OmpA family protein [Longimicrobiales bacterium]
MRRPFFACALAFAALAVIPDGVDAQILDRIRRTAERAAEREVLRAVDRTVANAVKCTLDDPGCVERAKRNGEDVVITDAEGNVITDADGRPVTNPEDAKAAVARPGDGAWSNYDFVPGERVLFAEDYANDRVGDFPRRLNFLNGSMEIVETLEQRWLRATSGSAFAIELPATLPDRFTLEFPVAWTHGNQWMRVLFADHDGAVRPRGMSNYQKPHLQIDERATGIFSFRREQPQATAQIRGRITGGEAMIRLMADGQHVKVFVGERRVANVPQVDLGRASHVWFIIADASEEHPMHLGSIRLAAGGADLYDRLEADGRAATQGILFDVDSDRIRPESTPTLEEIGTMLREHPDLRIGIEGHTDGTGDDAHNQQLSEKRAAAVRAHLIEAYGIDGGRLEAMGFGESRPVDSNDTPEGRQNNRRVELVRQ